MELIVKKFDELTTQELYEILKLRVDVFVVEQKCPYQEIDGIDTKTYHVFFKNVDGIQAYLRVIPAGIVNKAVAIGRVIARKRRCGIGRKILSAGIKTAQEKLNADTIYIEAQVYARALYENAGFKQISDEFLEDGIPHIQMLLKC